MSSLGWESTEQRFVIESSELWVTEINDATYVFMSRQRDDELTPPFFFGRVTMIDSRTLVVWYPDPEPFLAAVRNGDLKGRIKAVERSSVCMLTPSPELATFLERSDAFIFEEPSVYRKLASGENWE